MEIRFFGIDIPPTHSSFLVHRALQSTGKGLTPLILVQKYVFIPLQSVIYSSVP